ncbi:MAG: hypothetical protein HUK24_03845, partial [Sphaerochaetaceae bacterium]|nr:hypothetical protein [Sphaerochaetaceae bacterium]
MLRKKIVNKVTKEIKTKIKKKKFPLWLVILILLLAVAIFIFTPLKNPCEVTLHFDNVSEELALPAYSKDDIIVSHTGYTLSYSEEHEQPYWVAYVLTAAEVLST